MSNFLRLTCYLLLVYVSTADILIAQEVLPGEKSLPMEGESLRFNGDEAFIIMPSKSDELTPWVWYAPTLPGLPSQAELWMFERFINAGIAVAGIDVGESFGSPTGSEKYAAFYDYLTASRRFSERPILLARSRGGLMLYNWAAEHADSVGGIAGIYPVCNLESYPGLNRATTAYEMDLERLESELHRHNPIDRLQMLAEANVPIFHIHGDDDAVVPLEENSGALSKRYKELGGPMQLEVVKDQGHNMWPGWFQSKNLVDFVIENATIDSSKDDQATDPATNEEPLLTYSGAAGPGRGKHIVLIAAEQEYRSEQSMPMLAKVLSQHHGFDCTVLFSVNENGEVDPTLPAPFKDKTRRHRIAGLERLADADCVIWLSRFMHLPDDQIEHFHSYFDSGKPLIALRTANHGFLGGKKYRKNDRVVSLGELLGGKFMGHHGGWHRESTKGIVVEANNMHPILIGVEDIWGTSDVYRCHNDKFPFPSDCTALVMGQPLINLEPNAPVNEEKEPLPVAWTKTWTGNLDRESKIFHFTMGSAEDFENEGVRRMTVNAVYWGLGMEDAIRTDSSVEPIDDYQPLKAGFNYDKLGVRPRPVDDYR